MKLVIFGAGNIGRSFIGQLFANAGFEVVFIDVDRTVVEALNERRSYDVIVKETGEPDRSIRVKNVRAVHADNEDAVARELASTTIASTAVGKSALSHVARTIARSIAHRESPLDLILAENDREARSTVVDAVKQTAGIHALALLGIVETSIGKMVPIMPADVRKADPLLVFAEAYNKLIVDRSGFINGVPDVSGIDAVDNIRAYVDRKLYVHNLGHAAAAYLGNRIAPETRALADVLRFDEVQSTTSRAMSEAADAISSEYPAELSREALTDQIEDLLRRFSNAALGDTVYRVGRDVPRKIAKSDRITGAALLCARHEKPFEAITGVFHAALAFGACDDDGNAYADDEQFRSVAVPKGAEYVVRNVVGLSASDHLENTVAKRFLGYDRP